MMRGNPRRGMMIAAPSSGSGKTVFTLGLLRLLRRQGFAVCGAKAGPDFIDPMFHKLATGLPSFNLDPWAMGQSELENLIAAQAGEFMVIEAMMGLFDGAGDGTGSAGDLCAQLGIPVVLVVDCSKQSHSIAALIKGFSEFRQGVEIAGVILNKVGSQRHEIMLREAVRPLDIPVFGAIGRDSKLTLPERHLGLVQAAEIDNIDQFMENTADEIADSCDLEALISCMGEFPTPAEPDYRMPALGQNIAVACDLAFSFIYPHVLHHWQNSGSSITFFSPLADAAPPPYCDAVYLPGGYPELHGGQLAAATNFKRAMGRAADKNVLIYGECGGYMVLGKGLIDRSGKCHSMLGLLDLETSFEKPRLNLGYRRAKASEFVMGDDLKCHEFHYSTAVYQNGDPLFAASDAKGNPLGNFGLRRANVMGSYLHVISGAQ